MLRWHVEKRKRKRLPYARVEKRGGVAAVTDDGNDEFDDIDEKNKSKTLMVDG
jgi:hypothetical protein